MTNQNPPRPPSKSLQTIRLRLADTNSLTHFAVLGIASGLLAASVILLFRWSIDLPGALWLPNGDPENFEQLPRWLHFALPILGAIAIGLLFHRLPAAKLRTGVPHVISRLHAEQGKLPLANATVQFLGATVALLTGQSGGREGPAIHLGAAINSQIGQRLALPNNSLRVLVGCGTAAAIAASFNTPIAGVIFAMEVVVMEYTIAGFIPVMLAAVSATALTQAVFGDTPVFIIPSLQMTSLWELPFIVLLGLAAGSCAALFIGLMKRALKFSDSPFFYRMLVAGTITGCCALLTPQVLGIGYDSFNLALSGELTIGVLATLLICKIIATACSCGLGMPIGLVGPNLLIGACLGGVLGIVGHTLFPEQSSSHAFYIMLGMGAVMGASLNAPLAALMALLELTRNPNILFPGMLAIIIACLTTSELFRQRSAHHTVLEALKQLLRTDPVTLSLSRASVMSVMQRSLQLVPPLISREQAKQLLSQPVQWLVIEHEENKQLLAWSYAERFLQSALEIPSESDIDLTTPELQLMDAEPLAIQATLSEALNLMELKNVDAVFISGFLSSSSYPDLGILTRQDIQTFSQQSR